MSGSGPVLGYEDTRAPELNVTFPTRLSFPPYKTLKSLPHPHSHLPVPPHHLVSFSKTWNFNPRGSTCPQGGPRPHCQKLPRTRSTALPLSVLCIPCQHLAPSGTCHGWWPSIQRAGMLCSLWNPQCLHTVGAQYVFVEESKEKGT